MTDVDARSCGVEAPRPGASWLGDGRTCFRVWAPGAERVEVEIVGGGSAPLAAAPHGFFTGEVEARPGTRYRYRLDGRPGLPDPASRLQPDGVHGPSEVVDPAFEWDEGGWAGRPLADYVIYELHVGTFSPEGTFAGVARRLGRLVELGVTAVELMPVAQFPGTRNWGYDGVFPFAVQASYGGPRALKELVAACHRAGLAVVLDVVYNHLGPEGNYLSEYGPYFTERYKTPWGRALNFDGPDSDPVRAFFIENALAWVTEFRFDALRFDAVHAIADSSERPFLAELGAALHERASELGRPIHLIAESDLNTLHFLRPREQGGCGFDAQWTDDFHHALHVALTGEATGYYSDFAGLPDLARAYVEGFVYSGQYSPYRRRRHGVPARQIAGQRHVVCAQNHDQVGNRMLGERLSTLTSFAGLELAAAAVLLSPFVPLLFMGEEYGETAPFLYFIDHGEPDLVEAVRRGRREEFAAFGWRQEPPDPQDPATFERSRLDWSLRERRENRRLFEYYQRLIRLRREVPALAVLSKERARVTLSEADRVLGLHCWAPGSEVAVGFNFGERPADGALDLPPGRWRCLLDSAAVRWGGPGSDLPEVIDSGGGAPLPLAPMSVAVVLLDEPPLGGGDL